MAPSVVYPEHRASVLSRVLWLWIGPLLSVGYARPLQFDDLGELDSVDQTHALAAQLRARMASGTGSLGRRLWWAIVLVHWPQLLAAGVAKLVGDLLGFLGPISLAGIVRFCTLRAAGGRDEEWGVAGATMEKGYWWLIVAFVSAMLQNLLLQHHHQWVIRAGLRVRSALSLLVYEKALTVDQGVASGGGASGFSSGMVNNMLAGDTNSVAMVYWFVHYLWASPLQLAICMAMLYAQLGPPAFVALAILLTLIPLQAGVGRVLTRLAKATVGFSDARIKMIGEVSGVDGGRTPDGWTLPCRPCKLHSPLPCPTAPPHPPPPPPPPTHPNSRPDRVGRAPHQVLRV